MSNATNLRIEADIAGRWLRKFRLEARLTQKALAERAGIKSCNISGYENGFHLPDMSTPLRLAAVLGCEVEDIWA